MSNNETMLREAAARLVAGFNHVSGIARLWEPDHSSGADRAKWAKATEACADVARLLSAAPQPPAAQQGEAVAPTRADLIAALKFYAKGEHFILSEPAAWDTVSGEPQNWQCDEAGTATVEDGWIAKATLEGRLTAVQIETLEDGETLDDAATQPAAAPQPVAQGITNEDIRREFLAAGFTIKEGHTDLKPYVYEAARRILALAAAPAEVAGEPVAPDGRLHADGYFTWARREGYVMDRRLPCDFYLAAPPARQPEAAGVAVEPVASIYITPDGDREMDDWRRELPVGRNILYTAPPALQALTDEQMVECVRSIGLPVPMGLIRDRGPYEITEPSWFLTQLVRAIERAHGIGGKGGA